MRISDLVLEKLRELPGVQPQRELLLHRAVERIPHRIPSELFRQLRNIRKVDFAERLHRTARREGKKRNQNPHPFPKPERDVAPEFVS